jgi:hypothetical protein
MFIKNTGIFMATPFMVHSSKFPYEGTIKSEHIT